MSIEISATDRTKINRVAHKGRYEVDLVKSILDSTILAHIGMQIDGQPYAFPVAFVRDGERVLIHGSSGSHWFRALSEGIPICFTVSIVDGLVLARSGFESSIHYRSVMAFGSCTELTGDDKTAALLLITEGLLPGRNGDARPGSKKEEAATMVLSFPLTECSVKVSDKPPGDLPEDLADSNWRSKWAGHVPITQVYGEPVPDALTVDLGIPVPDYVRAWK